MQDGISIVSTALQLIARIRDVFASLAPLAARFQDRTDIDKLVEEFFAAELAPGTWVRVRGVLFPYSCFVPTIAYTPWVTEAFDERVKGHQRDPQTGHLMKHVQLEMSTKMLSLPASRFSDIALSDQTTARIAWLYPEHFDGLIFDHETPTPTADQPARITPADLFRVRPEQRPVLCLLPTTGRHDVFFGSMVEVVGPVTAGDSQIAARLTDSLDQFQVSFLSRYVRPFEGTSLCLAIDLRGSGAQVRRVSLVNTLNVIIGVQGLIDVGTPTPDEVTQVFIAALDAVPDRTGMGPLRSVGHHTPDGVSGVISRGDIRWVFDENAFAIAAYKQVNLADREQTARSIPELAHHWQAWQKKARRTIEAAIRRRPTIRPLFIWDPEKFQLFHPNGLQLPPRLEAQLFHHDPAIRRAVDWLRVGTGQFARP